MTALAIIPARFASTRFPGKPLADKTGKPLIQHVVERVRQARRVGGVVVATDDPRIFDAVKRFGGEAVMTGEHPNGTSRIAEAIQILDPSALRHPPASVILNVQGDEPEIEPELIDRLIDGLYDDPEAPMATLASPFVPGEDPANPNIVKVVLDQRSRAIYFSRSLIPFIRVTGHPPPPIHHPPFLKHAGLYAYRREFLLKYVTLPPTPLEQAEQLEQLRAIEHGHPIAVIQADARHHGIDTPEQYEAFVRRCRHA